MVIGCGYDVFVKCYRDSFLLIDWGVFNYGYLWLFIGIICVFCWM